MSDIKQVIIARIDLNMRKGKLAAQVAHASMKVFFDRIKLSDSKYYENNKESYRKIEHTFTNEMIKWMEGSFKKIVVGCNSEVELLNLRDQANYLNIVNALILDSGFTEFKQVCPYCSGIEDNGLAAMDLYDPESSSICSKCNGTRKIPKPTYTCLAIGPDVTEKIDFITEELKLL